MSLEALKECEELKQQVGVKEWKSERVKEWKSERVKGSSAGLLCCLLGEDRKHDRAWWSKLLLKFSRFSLWKGETHHRCLWNSQATQRDTEAEDLGKLSNSNEAAKSELEDRSSWWMLPQCYQPYWTPPFAGKVGSWTEKNTRGRFWGGLRVEGKVTIEGRSFEVWRLSGSSLCPQIIGSALWTLSQLGGCLFWGML